MKDEIHLEIGRKDIDSKLTTLTSAFEKGLEESKLFIPYKMETISPKNRRERRKIEKQFKKKKKWKH